MPRQRFLWLFRAACIDGENHLKKRTAKAKKNIESKVLRGQKKNNTCTKQPQCEELILEMQEKVGKHNTILKIDFFGQLQDVTSANISAFTNGINRIYEQVADDSDLKVGIFSEEESNNLSAAQIEEIAKMPVKVLTPGESILLHKEGIKVMIFAFEYPALEKDHEIHLLDADLAILENARKNHVDYMIAYGIRGEDSPKESLDAEEEYEKALSEAGCNYIVASKKDEIAQNRLGESSQQESVVKVASLGNLFGVNVDASYGYSEIGAGIILKTTMHFLSKEKKCIDSTEYIPYYVSKKEGTEPQIQRIDYKDVLQMKDNKIRRVLDYIDSNMGEVKYAGSAFTVKQICDVLGEKIPYKYEYLSDIPVEKVCTRASEVVRGDLLFVLEQYKFANDDDARPWILRKRIASVSIEKGAIFVISHRALSSSIPHIVVKNCREAHIKICREIRKKYDIKIVGVTGSVGKTSTKDMLFEVLKEKYNTHKSIRNANAQVNIGMHLQEIKGTDEFLVQEIDGSRPGSASRHSRMLLPEACVITNIGWAHIGNFGTQEKLLEAKLGVIDGMHDGGTLVVNWDDQLLAKINKKYLDTSQNLRNIEKKIKEKIENINVVSYAVDNKEADYYAEDICEKDGETQFCIVHGTEKVRARLGVIGKYNVLNAVCSYAIGKMYNIPDSEIIEGLYNFKTSGVRQNLMSVGGNTLFVDCFNSSPPSVESSLSVLDSIDCKGRKIAIIGDVTGADSLAEGVHKRVGEIINTHRPDIVVCYGKYSKVIFDKIKEKFQDSFCFLDKEKLNEFITGEVREGDTILFKGSSKMRLYERIDENFGTMLSDQVYLDDNKFRTVKRRGVQYNIYRTYCTAVRGCQKKSTVKVEKSILGLPVYNIGEKAFFGRTDMVEIAVNDGIRHIGQACFEGSGIREMKLPKTTKLIGMRAFKDCEKLKTVDVPHGVIHIGDRAFEGCTNLELMTLPDTVKEIGKDAFKGSGKLKVQCSVGSYVERYCIVNQIDYISVK